MNDHDLALAADFMIDEKYDLLAPHIRQHIEKCEQCSKNLMDLTDALSDQTTTKFPLETQAKKKSRAVVAKDWLVAASITLAIGTGIMAWQYYHKYNELLEMSQKETDYNNLLLQNRSLENEKVELKTQNSHYAASLKKQNDSMAVLNVELQTKSNVIASLYTPNPELEEEMGLILRSGNLDVLSPDKRKYTQQETLNFRWKDEPKRLGLAVYNNNGMRVQTISSIDKGFELPLAKFGLGLYYYELYYEDDLVAINSFEIH